MKCFHFSNGEKRGEEGEEDGVISRASKVTWVRSLSIASSSVESVRRSEFDSESRDFTDSFGFYEFLSQRRANDLRVFNFAELKAATRGFSRSLLIGEGGFGCVYKGVVEVSDPDSDEDSKMDVAVKQLNRSGFQACPFVCLFVYISEHFGYILLIVFFLATSIFFLLYFIILFEIQGHFILCF